MEYIVIIIIYCLALLLISIYANYRSKLSNDYLLGGRQIGAFAVGISVAVSATSTGVLIGNVGNYYVNGIGQGIWLLAGVLGGMYYNWVHIAPKIRAISENQQITTVTHFITTNTIGDKRLLRLLCSITIVFFFLIYISSLLASGGLLLTHLIPNLSYQLGVLIIILIVAVYVIIGGYLAVVWTDLFQGILIIATLLAFPFLYCYITNTGVFEIFALAQTHSSNVLSFNTNMFSLQNISFLFVGLGYFGQPHLLIRFLGIDKTQHLKKATKVGILWEGYLQILAFIIAVLALAYFSKSIDNPELAFILLSQALFQSPYVIALITVIIIAILVTTVNSQLLIISSNISYNFTLVTKKYSLLIFRIITILFSMLAYYLSVHISETIFSISLYAWAGLGASIGPLIIFISNKAIISTKVACLSIIIGMLSVIVWHNIHGGIFDIFSLGPAFLFSYITLFIGTYKKIKQTEFFYE